MEFEENPGGFICGGIAGVVFFFGAWIAFMGSWGLIGFCLGWIPALIGAYIVGAIVFFTWPILLLGIAWVVWMATQNS